MNKTMMAIESRMINSYRKEYERDLENIISQNYLIKKEEILKSDGVVFLIKDARFIDENQQLNMDQIWVFLSTPIWELEKNEWVAKYITYVRFCNEFEQFSEYYQWKDKQTNTNRKKQLKNIRQEYLKISVFDEVITNYQLDRSRMIASQKKFNQEVEKVRIELKKINDAIELLFSYEMMTDVIKNNIKKAYGVEVCPYCNRQFISWWEEGSIYRSTSDLDHILPKSIFPLFALNLYNLIPVCLVCNRYIKLGRYMPIWNPFNEGFDNKTKFIVGQYQNAEAYIGLNTDFELKLQPNKDLDSTQSDIVSKTIWFFKFNELYKNHKEYVRNLMRKKYIYTPEVVKELNQLLGERHVSQEEIELLLFGVTKDDINCNNEILGKLTYDILWGDL